MENGGKWDGSLFHRQRDGAFVLAFSKKHCKQKNDMLLFNYKKED